MESFDEVYERLALNAMECGAVCDLLVGVSVQPDPDPRAHIRKLLAAYSELGTDAMPKMSAHERLALLTEKQIHLQEVEGRCQRGERPHVNAVLRRTLKQDVKTIARKVLDLER